MDEDEAVAELEAIGYEETLPDVEQTHDGENFNEPPQYEGVV
jgi:hypothetical protein